MYSDEEEEVFSDEGIIDESMHSHNQKNYKILKDTDILQLLKEDIEKISTILSIPRDVSLALLHLFNWNVNRANEEWFTNEHEVRKSIGMLSNNNCFSVPTNENPLRKKSNHVINCGICFEEYSIDKVAFATCNKHPFCKVCCECYISTSINEGGPNKCLGLRCPKPSCGAMVGESMIIALASEKDRLKYYHYLFQSYVNENKNFKWCPAPGCECAVEFEIGSEKYDVICDCFNGFCWNCMEENHRPVDCDTIAKWITRNYEEAANTNWILAFTKKCPKCDKSIEKHTGCNHMTCRCGYDFCWICLKKWGTCYNRCNRYEEKKEIKEEKICILKYMHFYERWLSNEKSKQKALKDLKNMRDEGLKEFSELHSLPETEFEFIIEAWKQIVECRRVLKWTYAYRFYLPKDQEEEKDCFFQYLQGEAEVCLERLHHCAEKELMDHLGSTNELDYTQQVSYNNFASFRSKLIGLTKVTGNYFDKLVIALENGLKDVNNSIEFTRKKGSTSE
ncbi:hypothetical protein RND71_002612 [Anisodus tanguticus]|uniref:RBR-type E3 ubiquitin transferase n=1 Tax=Anisodus tanguticus TaxID=243964 RepID=A0AAE1T394_9SOLA|nr:hypothetical protein RND71_002612 [Anisodus tanguticus]